MERATAVMDALRDGGVERLRFKRGKGGVRVLAARPEGAWESSESLLPTALEDIQVLRELVEEGGHERLDLVFRREVGLRFFCAVHCTKRGPGAGGLRRHDLSTPEIAVVLDVLNLSRAMSYKNAAAGLGRGGSKICVHNPDLPVYGREGWLACLTEEIDISGTVTGPDSGYTLEVYRELAARSQNVSGVLAGGTSASAALGLKAALTATAAALGQSLASSKIVIQGLGHLGGPLAFMLAQEGCHLTVTDRDHGCIDAFLEGLDPETRGRVKVLAPYQILLAEGDILAPCAIGGVITSGNIPELKVQAICGAANNQLDAFTLREELVLARQLMGRNILYVPEWLASAGGAIHGVMEREKGKNFDLKKVAARVHRICGWQVDELLCQARQTGRSPLELAMERYLKGL